MTIKPFLAGAVCVAMMTFSGAPAFALGEIPVPTPIPDLSTPTPIPTVIPTHIPTPEITMTPLPSILPSDTTPPVITDVLEASLLSTDATIVWATDELAISTLEYGTTTSYDSSATLPATAFLAHAALLLNLSPGTTYRYCIHATDLFGNTANSCGHSFATAAANTPVVIDANPPTISDVSIISLTTSLATINWTTEEIANGEIEYGTTPSYGSTTPLESALSLNHAITLSDLATNTLYHYRIKSSDEIGNLATSPDNTFTTESILSTGSGFMATPSTAVISGIETAEISFHSVTIAWQTDIPSDSQVEYGDGSLFGQATTLDTTLSTSHSVTITGLSPDTNYYFRVKSKPVGVSVATVSANHDFNTLSEPAPVVPPATITAVSSSVTGPTSAAVSVAIDHPFTAQIEYGITTEYGLSSGFSLSATAHTFTLLNLVPGTTYQYRVRATDGEGNIIYSENYSLTTSPQATFAPTPSTSSGQGVSLETISNLSVTARDQFSTTLSWHTASDESDAAFWYDIRYSTSPITESNFNSALEDQVTLVPQADLGPQGADRSYIVAGLTPGIMYYFALKLKSEQNTYSALSNVPSAMLASPPQAAGGSSSGGGGGSFSSGINAVHAPTILNAKGVNGEIVFSWKNPNEDSFVRSVLVRKEGNYPTSPQDGQVVHEGDTETFTDTNLTNGKTYYYTMYSYNDAKQYSRGIQVSLVPRQGILQEAILENPDVEQITPNLHFVEILQRGNKDIEVEHLQEVLARDEGLYPEKLITGYFGTLTETALKKFQKRHNLPQTGITDPATQAKLSIISRSTVKLLVPEDLLIFSKDLSHGKQDDDVAALQKLLTYEGSYTAPVTDGIFGASTVQAVKTFQKKYGVKPVSGYFGVKTRHKVREITGL